MFDIHKVKTIWQCWFCGTFCSGKTTTTTYLLQEYSIAT